MTGTNEDDLMSEWAKTKPLVSAVLLEHGALVSSWLGYSRSYLSLRARSECTGETRVQAKESLALSRAFVRFAKAFKEMRAAARGIQSVFAELERSRDTGKGADGRPTS